MKENLFKGYCHATDFEIMQFLWRWKVATTAALAARFYPKLKANSSYRRLTAIEKSGLITFQADERGRGFVWMLTKKGFDCVKERLPDLKEHGFKSEFIKHDHLVTAFQLGDFLLDCPKSVEFFTEQELRRYDPESYPSWVPKFLNHRPDGFTSVISGEDKKIFAIEVERNIKKDGAYRDVGDAYGRHSKIHRVLWLVEDETAATRLNRLLSEGESENPNQHCFFLESDFLKQGWHTPCKHGSDRSKTVREIIVNKPSTILKHVDAMFMLDMRKARPKSIPCGLANQS